MKRWLTAVVLLPPLIGVVGYLPSWCFLAVIAGVAAIALEEFFRLARDSGIHGYRGAAHAFSLLLVSSFYRSPDDHSAVFWLLILASMICLILALRRGHKLQETLPSCGVTLLGLVYVSTTLGFLLAIHNRAQGDGPVWLLFLFLTIWLGDTAAYTIGSLLGKRPLAPRISPRKTWEGAIGALLGNSLAALMGQVLIPQTPLIPRFLLCWSLGIASQAGDLAESAIKRGARTKESADLLPGHGGMLDRIDGILFGAPMLYFYLQLFGQQ